MATHPASGPTARTGGRVSAGAVSGAEGARRVLAVLEAFSPRRPTLTARELAGSTCIPLPSMYRYIALLRETGFLIGDDRGAYHLAPRFFALARAAEVAEGLIAIADPVMRDLVRECGETVIFVRLIAQVPVCVHRVDPAQPDPAQPDPAQPDPAQPEPGQLEPVPPASAQPASAQPGSVRPDPARPDPARPEPAQPNSTLPNSTLPNSTLPNSTLPNSTLPQPTLPQPTLPPRVIVEPGEQLPLLRGASGRVLLAGLPADRRREALAPLAREDPTAAVRLAEAVERVALRGWATAEEEIDRGVWAASAPVTGRQGAVGALTVPSALVRAPEAAQEKLLGQVRAAASTLSRLVAEAQREQ